VLGGRSRLPFPRPWMVGGGFWVCFLLMEPSYKSKREYEKKQKYDFDRRANFRYDKIIYVI
jgi:hypothetical protein